ncbi:MAG: BrnT family toxin [Syntrophales bacterium]|nr:BrnT family toxin [Syntrophales bacterium]
MKIEKIAWDQDTSDHISRHAVWPEEVEEVLFNDSEVPRIMRGKEGRHLAYGKTNAGRYLFIVLIIANRKTRIITVRDMTDKEKKFYRRKK